MKPILSLLVICLFVCQARAQYAIVNDKDGFVYVRETAGINGRIIDTLKNGAFVWSWEPEANWINVIYSNGKDMSRMGYIYKDRLVVIDKMFESIPAKEVHENKAVFEKDSISIVFTAAKFDTTRDKAGYTIQDGGRFFTKVNGQNAYGTDGYPAKRKYASITVKAGDVETKLPRSAIENTLEPDLYRARCYIDRKTGRLYLFGANSDGAGAYVVLWIIENGRFRNRIIDIPF